MSFPRPLRLRLCATLLVPVLLVSAGCGGGKGGGGGSPSSPGGTLTVQTTWHDAGHTQKASEGNVDGQGHKQGAWSYWYPDGSVHWQASFTDDAFDAGKAWIEYNDDTSIRFDSTDGPPLNQPPS